MIGIVDDAGRALLRLRVKNAVDGNETPLNVWIDTGFTGDLVMPQVQIDMLNLQPGSAIKATLGDGSVTKLDTYHCFLEWFGEWKRIEVIANKGQFPLLGVGLLRDHELHVDYRAKTLTVN